MEQNPKQSAPKQVPQSQMSLLEEAFQMGSPAPNSSSMMSKSPVPDDLEDELSKLMRYLKIFLFVGYVNCSFMKMIFQYFMTKIFNRMLHL
jgi:hypothetical protein